MADEREARSSPRLVLVLLLLAYILNFLDRQILGILLEPIKADLDFTDSQLGILTGPAFALVYSLCGIPLALLADRTSRSGVITFSLAAWSGFTALCGTATGFWQLFLFRLGVGLGGRRLLVGLGGLRRLGGLLGLGRLRRRLRRRRLRCGRGLGRGVALVVGEELLPALAHRVGVGDVLLVHLVDQPLVGSERLAGLRVGHVGRSYGAS